MVRFIVTCPYSCEGLISYQFINTMFIRDVNLNNCLVKYIITPTVSKTAKNETFLRIIDTILRMLLGIFSQLYILKSNQGLYVSQVLLKYMKNKRYSLWCSIQKEIPWLLRLLMSKKYVHLRRIAIYMKLSTANFYEDITRSEIYMSCIVFR